MSEREPFQREIDRPISSSQSSPNEAEVGLFAVSKDQRKIDACSSSQPSPKEAEVGLFAVTKDQRKIDACSSSQPSRKRPKSDYSSPNQIRTQLVLVFTVLASRLKSDHPLPNLTKVSSCSSSQSSRKEAEVGSLVTELDHKKSICARLHSPRERGRNRVIIASKDKERSLQATSSTQAEAAG